MKEYKKWLQWDLGRLCNLDCDYCFDSDKRKFFGERIVNTDELSNFLKSRNEVYRIGLTGGEPFLIKNIIELCDTIISTGHVLSLNTNLVVSGVEDFVGHISPENVLFVHASYHYRELQRRGQVGKYLHNFSLLQQSGFNVYAGIVLYPGDYELFDASLEVLAGAGITPHVSPFIGYYEGDWYPDGYPKEKLEKLSDGEEVIDWYAQKGETCNAGFSAGIVDTDGDIRPCFGYKNKIGNIYENINWTKEPIICQHKKCGCPLNKLDLNLFEKVWR